MAERLQVIRARPAAVLDWWSGHGASAELLESAYPQAVIQRLERDAADAVSAPSAPWWSPRRWSPSALPALTEHTLAAQRYDLVWANMMLHWQARPQQQMRRWYQALTTGGFLMFSTLGPGSLAGLRRIYDRLGWGAPHAPFVDMHDLGDMLLHAGLAEPVMDQEVITMTWTDAPSLLSELRTLGGNADPTRFAGLRTAAWRNTLLSELGALRDDQGRYRLDFEVIYGHALRGVPAPRVEAQTSVPLEEMRAMVGAGRRTPSKPIGLG
jgi:malonyl-CoA O-methyltransferase